MSALQKMVSWIHDFHSSRRMDRHAAWQELAFGGLVQGCQEAVTDTAGETLEECWLPLQERGRSVIQEFCRAAFPNDRKDTDVDTERLYRHACGLLATARTAVAAQQFGSPTEAYEKLWHGARKAVEFLTGLAPSEPPEFSFPWAPADPYGPLHSVYDALAARGGRVAAARHWSLYWLCNHHNRPEMALHIPEMALRIPVVGYHAGEGFLAELGLILLDGGAGELVEHPGWALRPLGQDLLQALESAGKGTPSSVLWMLIIYGEEIPPLLPLDGPSLGAAAQVGFHLLQAGYPNNLDRLILAQVGEKGRLTKVAHEREKLEKAHRLGVQKVIVAGDSALPEIEISYFRHRGMELKKEQTVQDVVNFYTRGLPPEGGPPRILHPTLIPKIAVGHKPHDVVFAPDGTKAYVTNSDDYNEWDENTVSVIDVTRHMVMKTIVVGKRPEGVAIAPDGTQAYVPHFTEGTVRVIDIAGDTVVGDPISVEAGPCRVAFAPDGATAYVSNWGHDSVSVIDTRCRTVTHTIGVGPGPNGVAFALDGTKAYVTHYNHHSMSVIDTASRTVTKTLNVGIWPFDVAFTPDGMIAYVTNLRCGAVSVIEVPTDRVIDEPILVAMKPRRVAFSPDGTLALVAGYQDGMVSKIDVACHAVTDYIRVGAGPWGVAFAPDGTLAYVLNSLENQVSVLELDPQKKSLRPSWIQTPGKEAPQGTSL